MKAFAPALAALGAGVAAAAIAFLWQPGLDSLYDDSVSYLLMAQRFTPFHALDPAVAGAAMQEKYPPVFPLLLAFTGGAYDWRIAHAVVALCFAASVVLLGLLACELMRSHILGVLAACAFALLPGSWLIAKGILSEYPFIALTLATLWMHRRHGEGAVSNRAAAAFGIVMAAVVLTRSIGIALVAALAVAELWRFARERGRARLRAAGIALGVAAVMVGVWYLVRPAAGHDPYVQTLLDLAHREPIDAAIWLGKLVLTNVQALYGGWLHALLVFWGEPDSPRFLVALAWGILGLGAALYRAGEGEADGLYVAIAAVILVLWPFPGQMYRLAFPLVPLLLAQALWGVASLLRLQLAPATTERWTAIAGLLPFAACVPAVMFYIGGRAHAVEPTPGTTPITSIAEFYRIPSGPAAEDVARRELDVIADLDRLRSTLPADARVMWYTPNYVALLARREGVALRRPASRDDLLRQLRETGADYLYLADVQPRDNLWREGSPFYPMYLARGVAQIEWMRQGAQDELRAILLKVDRASLAAAGHAP
jgi:hypothetical protein